MQYIIHYALFFYVWSLFLVFCIISFFFAYVGRGTMTRANVWLCKNVLEEGDRLLLSPGSYEQDAFDCVSVFLSPLWIYLYELKFSNHVTFPFYSLNSQISIFFIFVQRTAISLIHMTRDTKLIKKNDMVQGEKKKEITLKRFV